MKYEEIKVLTNDFVNPKMEEKESTEVDIDAMIELLWKKKQRVQCLE